MEAAAAVTLLPAVATTAMEKAIIAMAAEVVTAAEVAGVATVPGVATAVADGKLRLVSPHNRGTRQAPQLFQPLPLPSFKVDKPLTLERTLKFPNKETAKL